MDMILINICSFRYGKRNCRKPTMIVAKTIKGKGISFMENEAGWHGTAPSDNDLERALVELGGVDNE